MMELYPCTECGGEMQLERREIGGGYCQFLCHYDVKCKNCGFEFPTEEVTPGEATAHWNAYSQPYDEDDDWDE